MSVAIITGSAGLIGSEAARYFAEKGLEIVGIDNDMRRTFFGNEASTAWNRSQLQTQLGSRYTHHEVDIRDYAALVGIFERYRANIELVIHTAAQPSHDWAAREPFVDFGVNATGTLNMLEATRQIAHDSPFIFTSTNKVYGDRVNQLPFVELETRWEIAPEHTYSTGVREDMSIDQTLHSLFGASKASADLLVQEYGRYFGMNTACFRGGCLTGPNHSGTQLHGFLAYLMKCIMMGSPYTVFGYKGKQVRDNIHSADLIRAFDAFFQAPRSGEVYNIGGGRFSNCSMLEAIEIGEKIAGTSLEWSYSDTNRTGDHMWWISDNSKFMSHYPNWSLQYSVRDILEEMFQQNIERWQVQEALR